MADYEEDVDAFAKAECDCGHPRYRHADSGRGACRETRIDRVVPNGLPDPVYDTDDPFALPTNWPPVDEWPTVVKPCCPMFEDAGTAYAEAGGDRG